MDVTCERCGTEYEFDETLLSGRGTSVKCTNCGHVFKVYPKARQDADRTTSHWRLRTRDGAVETIDSLRDLQRRIIDGELSPTDEIARGGQPWKPLGSIPELETFFRTASPKAGAGAPVEQEPASHRGSAESAGRRTEADRAPGSERGARQKTLLGFVPVPRSPSSRPPYSTASESPGYRQPSSVPPPDDMTQPSTAHSEPQEAFERREAPNAEPQYPGVQGSAPVSRGGARGTRIGHPPMADRAVEDAEYSEYADRPSRPSRVSAPAGYYDDDEDLPGLPRRGRPWTRWLAVGLFLLLATGLALRWKDVASWVGLRPDPATLKLAIETGDAAVAEEHLAAYDRAITSYRSVADAMRGDPVLAVRLARAYALASDALGGPDAEQHDPIRGQQYARQSLDYANEALTEDSANLEAAIARADALRLLGRLDESQAQLTAVRGMPFFRTAEYFRVQALVQAAKADGKLASGYESAEKAHDAEPDAIRYRLLLARAAMDANDASEAETQVQAVLTEHPAHPVATSLREELQARRAASEQEAAAQPIRVLVSEDAELEEAADGSMLMIASDEAQSDEVLEPEAADSEAAKDDSAEPAQNKPSAGSGSTREEKAKDGSAKKTSSGRARTKVEAPPEEEPPTQEELPSEAKAEDEKAPPSASAEPPKAGKAPGLAYDEYDRPVEQQSINGRPAPRDYNWHMRQAQVFLARGDYAGARAQFESALEQRPGSPDPTDGLGEVAMAAGDPNLALRYFRSAAQRGHQDAFFKLGTAYERLGRDEQAVAAYYTYLETHPSGRYAPTAKAALKRLESDKPASKE
jgi:predicted Zn finger-like uncharacterized protein